MKLRNKTLIIAGLTGAAFLTCSYFIAITQLPLIYIIAIAILFGLLTFGLTYKLVIRRTEELQRKTIALNIHDDLSEHITVDGMDETTDIANHINQLLDTFKIMRDNNEQHIQLFRDELTKTNSLLNNKESHTKTRIDTPSEIHFSQISQFDHVTSLPNRAFFNEVFNKTLNHAQRHKKVLAVLLLNIDNFKAIHSKLGEDQSDHLLKELGKRLTNTLRKEDILAKLEEDEFVILLDDIGKAKFAGAVAEKILQSCIDPFIVDTQQCPITTSIGICIYPNDGHSLEELFHHAENALNKAQHNGGANYQFYTQELDVEAREYIQLESALRKAIHNNELALIYQPKLNIKSGQICGVEALLRWNHPVLGIISPSQFIPLAEETGLIMSIGEWALREACKINKYWQDEGYEHLTISINLSPKQFVHANMTKIITAVLQETKLHPKYLELEITEKTVMDNIDMAATILNNIKTLGVQLSIDRFGTGYTCISALKQLPISILKIDQSFIKGIPNNPNDVAITNAFIALAHNLGMTVVAEGVETAAQVQYLTNQQCDMIQGYFLSHPVSASKITQQIKKLSERALV